MNVGIEQSHYLEQIPKIQEKIVSSNLSKMNGMVV